MSTEFSLVTELHDKALVIKTDGYINGPGGEKIVQEFEKHNQINKMTRHTSK